MPDQGDVTQLLAQVRSGNRDAADRLVPLVYQELRRQAGAMLRRERADHTLQPTALVNEAYLRLQGGTGTFQDRAHFFGIAANSMRQILIDYARRRQAGKRGDGAHRVELEEHFVFTDEKIDEVLAIDVAIDRLSELDARQGRIVELRYFTGLSVEETAEVMGISEKTVKRDWRSAKAFLHRQLSEIRA